MPFWQIVKWVRGVSKSQNPCYRGWINLLRRHTLVWRSFLFLSSYSMYLCSLSLSLREKWERQIWWFLWPYHYIWSSGYPLVVILVLQSGIWTTHFWKVDLSTDDISSMQILIDIILKCKKETYCKRQKVNRQKRSEIGTTKSFNAFFYFFYLIRYFPRLYYFLEIIVFWGIILNSILNALKMAMWRKIYSSRWKCFKKTDIHIHPCAC